MHLEQNLTLAADLLPLGGEYVRTGTKGTAQKTPSTGARQHQTDANFNSDRDKNPTNTHGYAEDFKRSPS